MNCEALKRRLDLIKEEVFISSLREACNRAKAEGMTIVRGVFGVSWFGGGWILTSITKQCCPIGALLFLTNPPVNRPNGQASQVKCVAAKFGITQNFVNGFWQGYDYIAAPGDTLEARIARQFEEEREGFRAGAQFFRDTEARLLRDLADG